MAFLRTPPVKRITTVAGRPGIPSQPLAPYAGAQEPSFDRRLRLQNREVGFGQVGVRSNAIQTTNAGREEISSHSYLSNPSRARQHHENHRTLLGFVSAM
jgi:hypothetical protein